MAEVDYEAVEHELCRIPDVSAARIVASGKRAKEVHIVASGDRQAGQVARDVQSIARAAFGLDLDGKAISVVQIGADEAGGTGANGAADTDAIAEVDADHRALVRSTASTEAPVAGLAGLGGAASNGDADPSRIEFVARGVHPMPTPGGNGRHSHSDRQESGRVIVKNVVPMRQGPASSVEVELRSRDGSAVGRATGTTATSSMQRAAAAATLDALRQLEPATGRADVESVAITRVGDRPVALVTVVAVVPPHDYEEALAGAAVVRAGGDLDAIARAVLDAMNRRMVVLAAV